MNALTTTETRRSVLIDMATQYGMEPAAFEQTLRATVVPKDCTKEQFAAFLLVAKEYDLNPITKEIYAFPTRGGGIQPIIGIDGWCNLINSNPQLDGIEFDDHLSEDGKKVTAVTCRIWRKDRAKPTSVTEYLAECERNTDPWKTYPRRMLRHKALIQGARYAFGYAGIVDPDEAERIGAMAPRHIAVEGAAPPDPDRPAAEAGPVIEADEGAGGPPEPGEPIETADIKPGELGSDQEWLRDLDGALSGCEDMVSLGEKQQKIMAPMRGKVSAQIWAAAERLVLSNFHRITGTTLDAG